MVFLIQKLWGVLFFVLFFKKTLLSIRFFCKYSCGPIPWCFLVQTVFSPKCQTVTASWQVWRLSNANTDQNSYQGAKAKQQNNLSSKNVIMLSKKDPNQKGSSVMQDKGRRIEENKQNTWFGFWEAVMCCPWFTPVL